MTWRDVLKVHPAADMFPMMSKDDIKALANDIKANGLLHKVLLTTAERSDGTPDPDKMCVLDGRNRLDAMEHLGWELFDTKGRPSKDLFTDVYSIEPGHVDYDALERSAGGGGDESTYVVSANIHRRHLTGEQKREVIAKLLRADPSKSNRQIAETARVDHKTVGSVRADLQATGEIPQLDRTVGADGRERPVNRTLAVLGSSASVEWYTPPEIITLVSDVLGTIDLDPSWHPESPVRAATTYTQADDGLSKEWKGRVFLNPPYGRTIDGWIEKLVEEHSAGKVSEAIALVPARVDTEWFRRLDAYPRCFLYGRLTFANAEHPAPFPCAAVYLGNDVENFASVFGQVGGVWVRLASGGTS
jgi:hypothetical protein